MKKKLTLSLLTLCTLLSFGLFSCKKDTQVTQQVNNAASENLIINSSRWQTTTSNGATYYVASYTIDNSILQVDNFLFNTDVVLIYGSFNQGSEEYPFMGDGTQMGDYYLSYGVSEDNNHTGIVTITASPIGNVGKPSGPLYIHAVYIQPEPAGGDPVQLNNIDKHDYNAVKKAFNLKN